MTHSRRAPMLSRWQSQSNPPSPPDPAETAVARMLPVALGGYLLYTGATGFLSTLDVAMRLYPSLAKDARPSGLALWALALTPFAVTALAGAMLTRKEAFARPLATMALVMQVFAFAAGGVSFSFTAGAYVTLLAVSNGLDFVAGWGPYVHIGRSEGPSFVAINVVPVVLVLLVTRPWRQRSEAARRMVE